MRTSSWDIVVGKETRPLMVEAQVKFNEKEAGAHCDLLRCLEGKLKEFAECMDSN